MMEIHIENVNLLRSNSLSILLGILPSRAFPDIIKTFSGKGANVVTSGRKP